jgi:sugar/nucleoside kinase (ribokinase family)
MGKYDILVVGDYCLDFIFTGLPSMPELGHEIVSTGFIQTPGGVCNNVIAMHRLGLKVGWLTNFGTDEYSDFILARIRKEGLDEEYFMFHDQPLRNVTVSLSFPDERAFIAYYDPNPLIISEILNLPKASGKAIYIPGLFLGREIDLAIPVIKAKKLKLIMDGNTNETHTINEKRVKKILKSLDLFLCNAREARMLTGENKLQKAIRILGDFVPEVVIKNGAEGSMGFRSGEVSVVPAIKVNVIDTTGAGDCFDAGFLKIWLSGEPLIKALEWGNIVGGLSTTEPGGVSRIIHAPEVEQYHQKVYSKRQ